MVIELTVPVLGRMIVVAGDKHGKYFHNVLINTALLHLLGTSKKR